MNEETATVMQHEWKAMMPGVEAAAKQLPVQPDFIIIGTMKSGTTSLHSILSRHPEVFMPKGEIQLFTVDGIGYRSNWSYYVWIWFGRW